MASSCNSSVAKMAVCLTCGDKGDIKRLICCKKCEDSVVHTYCMDEISSGVKHINWTCWECAPKVSTAEQPEPSRRSERISSRRNRAVKVRLNLKQRLRLNYPKTENSSITTKHALAVRAQMAKVPVKHEEVENAQVALDGPLQVVESESLYLLARTQSNEGNGERKIMPMFYDETDGELKLESMAQMEKIPMKHEEVENAQVAIDGLLKDVESLNLLAEIQSNEGNGKRKRRPRFYDGTDSELKSESMAEMAKVPVRHEDLENDQVAIDGPLKDVESESINLLAETQSNEGNGKRKRTVFYDETYGELKSESICSQGHHGSLSTSTSPRSSEHDDHQYVLPLSRPTWRGCFSIKGRNLGIFAHLSTTARPIVYDVASALPPVLDVAIVSVSDVWPKSFEMSPPTAGSIGLYFFPEDEWAEKVFDDLINDTIEHNLALKVVLGDVELLIFSSRELPLEHWRFRRKYYLWGVFRTTCRSFSPVSSPNRPKRLQQRYAYEDENEEN